MFNSPFKIFHTWKSCNERRIIVLGWFLQHPHEPSIVINYSYWVSLSFYHFFIGIGYSGITIRWKHRIIKLLRDG